MSERIDVSYRRHRIIAGVCRSGAAAMVYAGGAKLHKADGPTPEAALEEARTWIDDSLQVQRANRRLPYVGTEDEYLRAFQALSIGRHHEAMLRAHANAPDRTLTATELARAAGYDCFEAANAHYGRLGHKIADFLELQPYTSKIRNEPVWTMALADSEDRNGGKSGRWCWKMHEEVVTVLRALNMA